MKLAFECDLRWNDLDGTSNTRRHCTDCDRDVYNLSGMTRRQATRLLADDAAGLCVRFVSRNGQIVHDGDPIAQLRAQRGGAGRLLATAMLAQAAFLTFADDPRAAFFDPFRAVAAQLSPEPVERHDYREAMGNRAVVTEVIF